MSVTLNSVEQYRRNEISIIAKECREAEKMLISTDLIILRKTPYRETSLIFCGLSPEYGRLDFVARGERKLSGKKYPVIDLFREVQVSFRAHEEKTLHTAAAVDLVTPHDAVAGYPDRFLFAAGAAAFLAANSRPMLPCPLTWTAFRTTLCRLEPPIAVWTPLQCRAGLLLVFLKENGLLPEPDGERRRLPVDGILAAAIGAGGLPPPYPLRYWRELGDWLDGLCVFHGLKEMSK